MGWQTAVIGAIGAAQFQQQGAYGKFNQAVNNRNAEVKEQERKIIDDKLQIDLASFDKEFRKLEGSVNVSTAKSGVTFGGTAARIRLANLKEAELEKSKIKYNAEIGKARAFEEANFARIRGDMAREESKIAQLGTVTSVGTSLLTMMG
ncbi:putative internal virion protein [Pelagibacter phage Lederberg EXVC029P]|nr:putative internal virion protein [Pelagibacter phage Lederberg EXVC029P]